MNRYNIHYRQAVFAERKEFYQRVNTLNNLVQNDSEVDEILKLFIQSMTDEALVSYLVASDELNEIEIAFQEAGANNQLEEISRVYDYNPKCK